MKYSAIVLTAFLLASTACRQEPAPAGVSDSGTPANAVEWTAPEPEEQLEAERLEAERLAAERAAEELARREALVAEREEQLEREEALRRRQAELARRQAAVEKRERELARREKELENYETNLAFQAEELERREQELERGAANAELGAPSGADRDDGGVGRGPGPVAETFPGPPADEPAFAEGPTAGDAVLDDEPAAESAQATLQPGKVMEVEILETLTSRTSRVGDRFSARLVQELRAEDGTLVVPAGAEVIGEVTEVTPLKRVGGQASLDVEFTHIVVAPGETVAIRASFAELGADKRKDKKRIAGAAVVGAILGRVLGGKGGENAAAGAAVGAAAGAAVLARAKGKDAEIPAGRTVALQLEEVVTVTTRMTGPVRDQ